MTNTQSPITLGEQLKKIEAGGFILTETLHLASLVLPHHDHECANINFTMRGSFREIIGSRPHECGPSSLLVKPAGKAHANVYGSTGAHSLIIEVTPRKLEMIRPFSKLFERSDHIQNRVLAGLATRIYQEMQMVDSASPLMIEGLILELLAQATQDNLKSCAMPPPQWLAKARELIHEQFAETLSLSSIAAAVGINSAHLARMFRQYYRCTVGEYVRRRRIDYAIREVFYSDKPLSQIAIDAGFYDQSQLTRTFKLHVRMTPAQFRLAIRPRNADTKKL